MTLDRYSEWVTNRGSFILGDAMDCALFTKMRNLTKIWTILYFGSISLSDTATVWSTGVHWNLQNGAQMAMGIKVSMYMGKANTPRIL